jgi:beta-1,2-mannobiose phosphorylase / 1,2-beta-oligomannan phosphorylase
LPDLVAEKIKRFKDNPILLPKPENAWESKYVFNPGAIDLEGVVYILYRAMGENNVTTVGLATSKDGIHIDERLNEPIYVPRELFESKGCEDARIVEMEGRLYMSYTAYDGVNVPRIAMTSISKEDFISRQWNWEPPALISQAVLMDKNACILPKKIDDGYMIYHRMGQSICYDFIDSLDFSKEKLNKCIPLLLPRYGMWDSKKVGISAPPFLCDVGWMLLYHGVGEDNVYRIGAALFDKDNPTNLVGTTSAPILEPEFDYEKIGQIPNVVFPCGTILRDGVVYIYYGGADSVVGGATVKIDDLIKMFDNLWTYTDTKK